ncbi:hypothetical protein ACFL9S_17625 [Erwinia sp. AnSW2-5]|uniref:hypothetical protein n=1 Tax=Erwinia sp. AnSW2-5 TaxID=3367692 RepID=UPI00385F9DA5
MVNIGRNVVYFSAPAMILVVGLCALFFIHKKSTFSCDADILYFENNQMKGNLQLSLHLYYDNTGSFDLYGYANNPNTNSTTKMARRVNFKYKKQNSIFFIEHTNTIKYNNDNTKDSMLPEFISSTQQIINIEKLNGDNYIVYDKVSPAFTCKKNLNK